MFVTGAKKPMSDTALRSAFKDRLNAGAFTAKQVGDVSLHSFRVYLACALLQLGRTHAQIQALLRWKCDEALRIYARLNSSAYADLLDGVGDVVLDQARTHNLPQHDVGERVQAMRDADQSGTLHAAADNSDRLAAAGEDDPDEEE